MATVAAALALAVPAAAGLPKPGVLVPGRSLGGVRLGESRAAVRAVLGTFYGVCRGCVRPTWYFTYGTFERQGLAVEFQNRRVSGLFTLWKPHGWRGPHGLTLGATPLEVHQQAGTLQTITCAGYDALAADSARARTVYYVFQGRLWGFGLFLPRSSPCR